MGNEELAKHWLESSDDDFRHMESMFKSGGYHWALFIGHLVLEKLLKAIYAKRNPEKPQAPKIHNLNKLAQQCGIELDAKTFEKFAAINRFNIDGRYEDYKREFYKLCTREYAKEQIEIIKEKREWLKSKLI